MGQLPDNSAERDALAEEISKLESAAVKVDKPKLPTVTLDKLEYTPPSDAALEQKASDSLAEYKKQNEAAIRAESSRNAAALEKQRDDYADSRESDLKSAADVYSRAVDSFDNDVLKRGLARSSVAALGRSDIERDYANRSAEIASDYGKKITAIDAEISAIGAKLNNALSDFNLSYAVKLNEKLDALKTERAEKIAEATKYNNEIKRKQAELDADRLKTESALYNDELERRKKLTDLDVLSVDERDAVYKSVYDKMDGFLATLSPEQAKLEVRNHTLYRNHLSDYYYYKLYDKYAR